MQNAESENVKEFLHAPSTSTRLAVQQSGEYKKSNCVKISRMCIETGNYAFYLVVNCLRAKELTYFSLQLNLNLSLRPCEDL